MIKASTLVEILVALIIISVSIGLCLTVFFNNTGLADAGLRQKCNFEMETLLNPDNGILLATKDYRYKTFSIRQQIEVKPSTPGLVVVTLTGYTLSGRKLLERKELVVMPRISKQKE